MDVRSYSSGKCGSFDEGTKESWIRFRISGTNTLPPIDPLNTLFFSLFEFIVDDRMLRERYTHIIFPITSDWKYTTAPPSPEAKL